MQNLPPLISLALQGAIVSSILPAFFTLVAVLTFNRSLVSKARKLPIDSDMRLLLLLAGLGGAIAGISGTLFGGAGRDIDILTALICFKAGVFFTLYRLSSLNNAYLARARSCLDAGDYRGAIEDASEVARSSERLRKIAMEIKTQAERIRSEQLVLKHGLPA